MESEKKSVQKTKTVSGSDRADSLDFKNSLRHFVICIAYFCHYRKFSI